ncbi:hypothetical protein SapgrDRAFT_2980 [Saprospira grandis DSM 2844]|uniref:Uncharacterized protein n=1 Tax=Saprospira grandis DSM 2844 TaxID=694433 RepID=J0P470_9BACT|nr:hypothetical protein SapgrDRAFT_2980 [Saprospira grandis DSM 2844]
MDVEWGCCMAAGFNLQPRLAGGEAAAKERSDLA